jgi:hypothetical protein
MFGAFPGRDDDGERALTLPLPDADGVVRPHPHHLHGARLPQIRFASVEVAKHQLATRLGQRPIVSQ